MAGETVSWNTIVVAFIGAKVWFVPMSIHTIGFMLMAKKDRKQRETGISADSNLILIRF
jgi:hypothetical protein